MKWFAEKSTRQSEKNGTILVRRDLGVWRVSVNDCGQTTDYTHAMWVDAFKRLEKSKEIGAVTHILMLGLGAGGEIKTLHKNFPHCAVTVVEYDPEMVALAKELKLYDTLPFPEMLLGDAAQVVPTIVKKFDLIILDLFLGPEPSPLAQDATFLSQLKERLLPQGLLLVNVYKRVEYLAAAKKIFPHADIWKFRLNNFGAFW